MVQFGASTDSNTTAHWRSQGPIPDDPQWLPRGAKRFRRGMVKEERTNQEWKGVEVIYVDGLMEM